MRNNNAAIIRKMTRCTLSSDKRRNFFIITAIALTTLLLSSVFSIGMSFWDSHRMQEVRLMGTVGHVAITHPTPADQEKLSQLSYVKAFGTGNHVATVNSTPKMGDMSLSLHYFDQREWEEMRQPAYTDIIGHYPQEEKEIMIPSWILQQLDLTPQIGMEIPLSYTVETGSERIQREEVFILSGWFTNYMYIRSNNIDSILVSKALSQKYGKTPENDGAATIQFHHNTKINDYSVQLEKDLSITDTQRIHLVPMYDINGSEQASAFAALGLIVLFLVLTGYLLIYNVLYISVARDVRFYGLLKTIGTTPRQIRRIMMGQVFSLCAIGIPIGLLLATLLSFALVPALITKISTITTGTVISFSPLIYIGAAGFSLLTALLGAATPTKKAAEISPIEAQKYTSMKISTASFQSFVQGKPYRMALRNIFRDGKRGAVVLLSLFLALTTFITVTSIVMSMDTDHYVASYVKSDFILTNNTALFIGGEQPPREKFDPGFLAAIADIPGLTSLQYDTRDIFRLTYADSFDAHLEEMLRRESATPEEITAIKHHFTCVAVGIDEQGLSNLHNDVDLDAFARGECLLLAVDDPSHYEKVTSVELMSPWEEKVLGTIPVGGFVPYTFHTNVHSVAPTLIMSNSLMERLSDGAVRSTLYLDVEEGTEMQFLEKLKALTDDDGEISRQSKIEAAESLRDTKMILYILGGGVAFVLGSIGVLNFVNVMSVGIIVRKRELAILESIGMSHRQMRQMLLGEGLGYGLIALFLAATVGNAITYGLFKLFQQQADYAVFTYPTIPVLTAMTAVFLVCIITPDVVYRAIRQTSIVERLKESE